MDFKQELDKATPRSIRRGATCTRWKAAKFFPQTPGTGEMSRSQTLETIPPHILTTTLRPTRDARWRKQ
eukprot:9220851-Pyramimonas_sp.AAC.1